MVFRRKKEIPPGSGRWYWYEQRSQRDGGRVQSRHQRYLGPVAAFSAGFNSVFNAVLNKAGAPPEAPKTGPRKAVVPKQNGPAPQGGRRHLASDRELLGYLIESDSLTAAEARADRLRAKRETARLRKDLAERAARDGPDSNAARLEARLAALDSRPNQKALRKNRVVPKTARKPVTERRTDKKQATPKAPARKAVVPKEPAPAAKAERRAVTENERLARLIESDYANRTPAERRAERARERREAQHNRTLLAKKAEKEGPNSRAAKLLAFDRETERMRQEGHGQRSTGDHSPQ